MNALEWAPAYNSGQGVPGTKMEELNKGPKIPRRPKRKKMTRVPRSKMKPRYIAHPEPPIRTDEGAR